MTISMGQSYTTPKGREFTVVAFITENVVLRCNKPPYRVSYIFRRDFEDLVKAGHYARIDYGG